MVVYNPILYNLCVPYVKSNDILLVSFHFYFWSLFVIVYKDEMLFKAICCCLQICIVIALISKVMVRS